MIHSICLNTGYTCETEYCPLLIHNHQGFPTVIEFIHEFREFLIGLGTQSFDNDTKWTDDPVDNLFEIKRSTLDDLGFEFDNYLADSGWILGDPNAGPYIMIYNGRNAIECEECYYIFYPGGRETYVRDDNTRGGLPVEE